jgi:hypothetical protein
MQAYCVKCHAKKEMKDAKAITIRRPKAHARPAAQKCLESVSPRFIGHCLMELIMGWISLCQGCSAFFILRSQQYKLLSSLGQSARLLLKSKYG